MDSRQGKWYRAVIWVPPGGYVAGIYARTDIETGVNKAPANKVVKGVMNLELIMKSG